MRVSLNMLYDNYVTNMNRATYKLMELNKKASSQKSINKPSDDPIGAARVLSYRDSISALEKYKSNMDTAQGWLGLSGEALMQVNNVLIRAKEVAEQGSTGTLNADQREILAYEARQLFDQMINLANSRYEGKSIFAGHKVNESAFDYAMNLTSNDALPSNYTIEGKATGTILVQFENDYDPLSAGADYRFSTDGGKTWSSGTVIADPSDPNRIRLDLDGVSVTVPAPTGSTPPDYAVKGSSDINDTSGTWLWVRPTAKYLGDDEDQDQVKVEPLYAPGIVAGDVNAIGFFDRDVTVRIDDVVTNFPDVEYSYSLDGGSNWKTGNTATVDASGQARFLVPGGRLEIDLSGASNLNDNDQILIRPNRAAINFEIAINQTIQVNHVGKDVFGGIYMKPGDNYYTKGLDGPENVFETLGELIGYLETNNQSGVSQVLEDIDASLKHINQHLASVGSRENRLNISKSVISGLVLNERERLSKIEDVDITKLMTDLANQQIIYEAVLRSSSTIMRMSLVNHI